MGILDAVLKLVVAFMLMVSPIDKLILYTALLLAVSILVRFIYTVVCNKHFEECRTVKIGLDKELFRGLFSFAGWNVSVQWLPSAAGRVLISFSIFLGAQL